MKITRRLLIAFLLCASAFAEAGSVSAGNISGAGKSAAPASLLPTSVTSFASFGDSITSGVGLQQANQSWSYLVAQGMGFTVASNAAVPGYTVGQVFGTTAAYSPVNTVGALLLPGSNDISDCTTAPLIASYANSVMALAAWLGLPNSQKVSGASITYTGTWSSFTNNSLAGKYTSQAGATASATVSGTAVYVGGWAPSSGTYTFTITIDGVSQGLQTINPYAYQTEYLLRFNGLSSGSHTVVMTFSGSGADAVVQWFGGNGSGSGLPFVGVGAVIPRTSLSNTTIGSMNSSVQSNLALLAADGLSVLYVNDNSILPQSSYTYPTTQNDGIHPTPYGHMLLASAWLSTIYSTPPSYPAAAGSGGDYLAQVLTSAGFTPGTLLAFLQSLQQFSIANINQANSTTATAGSATLPANPLGFVLMNLGGSPVKFAYYGN